jgi:hypothetical protein
VRRCPKSQSGELSVAIWVQPDRQPDWPIIAADWPNSLRGQFHLALQPDGGDLSVFVTQPNGQQTSVREGPSRPMATGVWHHVAFVADKSSLRLYRGGHLVASGPCQGVLADSGNMELGIGCKIDEGGGLLSNDWGLHWQGRLDELAIFHRALSEPEISSLAKVERWNLFNKQAAADTAEEDGISNHPTEASPVATK